MHAYHQVRFSWTQCFIVSKLALFWEPYQCIPWYFECLTSQSVVLFDWLLHVFSIAENWTVLSHVLYDVAWHFSSHKSNWCICSLKTWECIPSSSAQSLLARTLLPDLWCQTSRLMGEKSSKNRQRIRLLLGDGEVINWCWHCMKMEVRTNLPESQRINYQDSKNTHRCRLENPVFISFFMVL